MDSAVNRAATHNGLHNERGFTLIEVLVASLLLLIVLIPVLGIFMSSVSASLKVETENAASLLAQEQIEELRGMNYASVVLDSNRISAGSDIDTSGDTATYGWADSTYNVVAEDGGSVDPGPEIIDRRNVSFTVQRYILWVDDPTDNDTTRDYKKALVEVSWESPQPGSMTFETNIHQVGSDRQEKPGVVITFPYVGDAFKEGSEIGTIRADAWDRDGRPVQVHFEYKKNIDANFSNIGTDTDGSDPSSDGTYEYSHSWTPSLSEHQWNLRATVTDDEGLTGTVNHPIFIDTTAPEPPTLDTDNTGSWPPTFAWTEVEDFIDNNTNYNMVVGYLVIRDVLPADVTDPGSASADDMTSTALAQLSGSDQVSFSDVTDAEPLDPSSQVRYRIRSLGRADYWYGEALADLAEGEGEVTETTTSWANITTDLSTNSYGSFTAHGDAEDGKEVVATSTSWSAVSLTWVPQTDESGRFADLYLIYGNLADEAGGDWKLVGTVSDPDPTDEADLEYVDTHLERNTAYQYRILPVNTAYAPDWDDLTYGYSNAVTTRIY